MSPLRWAKLACWLIFISGVPAARAQPLPTPVGTTSAADLQIELGLGTEGLWKLGHICPLRVRIPPALQSQVVNVEVESIDGDGVTVLYRQSVEASSNEPISIPIRVGRQNTSLVVRLYGPAEVMAEAHISSELLAAGLPSTQPLIAAIGSAMGVQELSRTSADGTLSTYSTALLDTATSLPSQWRDYTGCELVLLSCRDSALLNSLSEAQWQALDDWIRRGGSCIITLGGDVETLQGLPQLAALLPGRIVGEGLITNPGTLESLITTDQPLESFATTRIELERGRVDLSLVDSLSRPVPWWVSYSHGLGTVRLIASDLSDPAFEQWKDRKLLWQRLLEPYIGRALTELGEERSDGESSYLGYNDLVGQLRATMDVFPNVRIITFGQVAALLIGILLLIGPIDYFLSVRWLKRPVVSWFFAGAVLLAASLGLAWLYGTLRPDRVRINAVQVVDVDAATGLLSGRMWGHIYSGSARRFDITAQSQPTEAPVRADWQGLPGRGLGGLMSQLNTDRGMPAYEVSLSPAGASNMQGVGIAAGGTKAVYASWLSQIELQGQSQLREISGVDQLEGVLINPLPVDLLEPMILYHNWFYGLDSRIPAGGSLTISYDTIPKDLARRLNGRRTVEGREQIERWDPADRNSVDRLLELMMFHEAAAGRNYTSLAHRYELHMDLSRLLELDRAILVGRLEQPLARLEVEPYAGQDESELDIARDLDHVWCRIAIPVQRNDR